MEGRHCAGVRPVAPLPVRRHHAHGAGVKRAIVFLSIALGACGLSNGRCDIPDSEQEIRASLAVNLIGQTFRSNHVTDMSPAAYLAANPTCCSVKPRDVSFLDWLIWDRYSLPRYDVEVDAAYRLGPTTQSYYNFGTGDSCGRVPDTFGEGSVVDGPPPPELCSFTEEERRSASGVLICAPPQGDKAPATSVPIEDARRMKRHRIAPS